MTEPKTARELSLLTAQKLELMEQKVNSMNKKLDDIHDLVQQTKGAKWAISAVAAFGGVIGSVVTWIITHLPKP